MISPPNNIMEKIILVLPLKLSENEEKSYSPRLIVKALMRLSPIEEENMPSYNETLSS